MIIFLHDPDDRQETDGDQYLQQLLEGMCFSSLGDDDTEDEPLQEYESTLTTIAEGLQDEIELDERLRRTLYGRNTTGDRWQKHEDELADIFARSKGEVDLEYLPFSDLDDLDPEEPAEDFEADALNAGY